MTEADEKSHWLLDGLSPTKTIERHPEHSPERASNLGESKDEVKDDVPFCGQASFGHPEQVERSNDSLTKACRDTAVALWPQPF